MSRPEQPLAALRQTLESGLSHHRAGRLEEAERHYRKALEADPDQPDALHLLGLIAHQFGKNELAAQLIARALAIKPANPEALVNLGNAQQALERRDEALASYDGALALRPDYAMAWSNRATVLQALKRYDEALASYDKALAIKPGYAEALRNRGVALHQLRRYDEALASYDEALASKPDYVEALSNRGLTLQALKRHDEALASYGKALAIDPMLAEAHANEGLLRLLLGDFELGWKQYQWRWKGAFFSSASSRSFPQPLWLGKQDIEGKTLLVHAEQGLGDTLQFVRYAPELAGRGATVVLEVQPALKALLANSFGACRVLSEGEPLPDFDLHCPFLSLPLAFDTRLDGIPAQVPYLAAPAAAIEKWGHRLGRTDAPKIGIVWSGRSTHANDANRSIALSRLIPLASSGARLVSLQNEVRAEDASALAASPETLHFGAELEDFSDTAALVSLLDLVVSVDTSVAHLAGALGKPVWILLPFAPDWRWLLDREDSPWYPTARLFRQPRIGDWDSVLDRVGRELASRFG